MIDDLFPLFLWLIRHRLASAAIVLISTAIVAIDWEVSLSRDHARLTLAHALGVLFVLTTGCFCALVFFLGGLVTG